jgi:phosphatidylserine decarboxylase
LPYQPVSGVNASDPFWLKDDKYSLNDMFGDYGFKKGYSDLFIGGTVYQAFLSALLYHHWHAPIDGEIMDIYSVPGTYFLDQSQALGYFDPGAPNDSQSFISATAARMVMLIKAKNQKLGYVAIVFVGNNLYI